MERELEVKILNMDFKKLEDRILQLGGEFIQEEMQKNILIDSSKTPIKSYSNSYLRIRETENLTNNRKSTEITFKKNLSKKGLRDNVEYTTKIENPQAMLKILKELGFDLNEIGYKKRKSYKLKGARFDFDFWDEKTYPYPYMEIEVKDLNQLEEMIKTLNIPKENISYKSIVELRQDIGII